MPYDLFPAFSNEPVPLHPFTKESITAYILDDDETNFRKFSEMLYKVEKHIFFSRFLDAIDAMDDIGDEFPLIRAGSPSYHYLYGRLRGQQGYPNRAIEHWKKAYQCFTGYTDSFISPEEGSQVLRILMTLVVLRGDEGTTAPSREFTDLLVDSYEFYVKGRNRKDLGYFHFDLLRMYTEYFVRTNIHDGDGSLTPLAEELEDLCLKIITDYIQTGHFFAIYSLWRSILKSVGRTIRLEVLITTLSQAHGFTRDQYDNYERLKVDILCAAGDNILEDYGLMDFGKPENLKLALEVYKKATYVSLSSSDKGIRLDTKWREFVVKVATRIHDDRQKFYSRGVSKPYKAPCHLILEDFRRFYNSYSKQDNAARIGDVLEKFEYLFKLGGLEKERKQLLQHWAVYQNVTGVTRGPHPYRAALNSLIRAMDLELDLKACESFAERNPHLPFNQQMDLLKTKYQIQLNLGMYDEATDTAMERLTLAGVEEDKMHIMDSRFEHAFARLESAVNVPREKYDDFVKEMLELLDNNVKQDYKLGPTSTQVIQKAVLQSSYIIDHADGKNVSYEDLLRSIRQFEIFAEHEVFAQNANHELYEAIGYWKCIGDCRAGFWSDTFAEAREIAIVGIDRGYLPELGRNNETEEAEEPEHYSKKVTADWRLLYIWMYLHEYEEALKKPEGEERTLELKSFDPTEAWEVFNNNRNYFRDKGDLRRAAVNWLFFAKLGELHEWPENALDMYKWGLRYIADATRYGFTRLKTFEYLPELFRCVDYKMICEGAIKCAAGIAIKNGRFDHPWSWLQILKAHELCDILGSQTIWKDGRSIIEELDKYMAFTLPPPRASLFEWVGTARKLLTPGACHGEWKLERNAILRSQLSSIEDIKLVIGYLERYPDICAALSMYTFTPPDQNDIDILRRYGSPGQAIIFVDYMEVGKNIWMFYNRVDPKKDENKCPMDQYGVLTLDLPGPSTNAWVEDVLNGAIAGNDISDLLEMGSVFVKPFRQLAKVGDLVIIGNSPLTSRIPFQALPVSTMEEWRAEKAKKRGATTKSMGKKPATQARKDRLITLGQCCNVVYSPNFLATLHCMNRLACYKGRPRNPWLMLYNTMCAVAPLGTSQSSKNATRDCLNNICKRFPARASFYDRHNTPKQKILDTLHQTTDFIHFLGEVTINPDKDKPINSQIMIGPGISFTAHEITNDLHFPFGNSPLVTIISQLPERLPGDFRMKNLPDAFIPAFIKAGASSVVTTLWPVPNNIALRFTELFFDYYRRHIEKGDPKPWDIGDAMRLSCFNIRQEFGEKNPHWAAFILNGAWVRGTKMGGRIFQTNRGFMKSDWENYRTPRDREGRE
ncbi:hypothetical protein ABW19_dt0206579 [Dactylella cylindrospora]|nr:hypothetical protein ABW19_dt0206579 [Dactylella cylindrospora]